MSKVVYIGSGYKQEIEMKNPHLIHVTFGKHKRIRLNHRGVALLVVACVLFWSFGYLVAANGIHTN